MKKEVLRRALGRAFRIMGTLLMAGIFVLESHYANTLPRSLTEARGAFIHSVFTALFI